MQEFFALLVCWTRIADKSRQKWLNLVGLTSHGKTRAMSGLTEVTIQRKRHWAPGLLTLELSSEVPHFVAGQFFNLGLETSEGVLRRSYSAASAPLAPLEFFLSEVEGGGLTPRIFQLEEGDSILLDRTPLGFFTLKEVPEAKSLWMVATGTGLGPFISMLREGTVLDRFEKLVVVHGVRHEPELGYRDELEKLAETRPHLKYVAALSAASSDARALGGRITTLFESGRLEEDAQCRFDRDSHMLLCGNPRMIEDMTTLLKVRGFEKHRRRQPGHFNFEKYW